jgi:hypothetical protein
VTYARVELWMATTNSVPVRADLYLASDKLAKRARFVLTASAGRLEVSELHLTDEIQPGRHRRTLSVSRAARCARRVVQPDVSHSHGARRVKHAGYCALILMCASSAHAAELSGTLRATGEWRAVNDSGVLAPAAARLGSGDDLITSDFELRGAAGPVAGTVTLQHIAAEHREADASAILNELNASTDLAGWYLTGGKKIVSWDVGYAFRPLDVIQQEDRRRLVATTLEGIPVLMAERFSDDAAWSVVVANPGASHEELGRDEAAVAARAYWRVGAARLACGCVTAGAPARVSVEPLALVAGEVTRAARIVLYAPAPRTHRRRRRAAGAGSIRKRRRRRRLAGARRSVLDLAEQSVVACRDLARRSSVVGRPVARMASKARHLGHAAVVPALRAGAIAMQARALGVTSLHRDNVLTRIAWSGDSFYPSADMLYTPADGGAIATVRLEWRGGRTAIEAGWRYCFGPADSMARQLPFNDVAFLSASVSL